MRANRCQHNPDAQTLVDFSGTISTMRTKLLKASIIFALLAILLGMPLLLTPERIRPEIFARIQPGMTEAEVEELLGAKPGDYDGFRAVVHIRPRRDPFKGSCYYRAWGSRYGSVCVEFHEGRVQRYSVDPSFPANWWGELIDRWFPGQKAERGIRL